MGADSKRPLATLLGVLLVACGGGTDSDDDESSMAATPSSTSGTATVGTTATTTSTSGGGATTSGGGATTSGSAQTASTTSASTSGNSHPWVCLEISSGCLCSTIPGSEGETEPCAAAYDCCYGLEGSTCYCLETPEAMCDEIIDVGYQRYDSCPPP